MVPFDASAREQGFAGMKKALKKNAAMEVRRAFRAGRPFKTDQLLHPRVALAKAREMLADLRKRMCDVRLDSADVGAELVAFIPDEKDGLNDIVRAQSLEQSDADILSRISDPSALITGVLFFQMDRATGTEGTRVCWPYHFLLGNKARAVMRYAGESLMASLGGGNYKGVGK